MWIDTCLKLGNQIERNSETNKINKIAMDENERYAGGSVYIPLEKTW